MFKIIRRLGQTGLIVGLLAGSLACANTARGVVKDTKELPGNIKEAVETMDVKTALIADATLDADNIDVDTYHETKTIVLRGSVPTEEQKVEAEKIARQEAPGWRIENRLAVVRR